MTRLAAAITLIIVVGPACSLGPSVDDSTRQDAASNTSVVPNEGDPRLKACLEAAGYDYAEVWPPWSSAEPPPQDSVFADPAFWEDFDGCLQKTGLAQASDFGEARIASENREVLQYVGCMRDRGWNLPDPEPWEGPPHPGLLERPMALPKDDREAMDQYYRDSFECGFGFYDDEDNLLPRGRD
jgi:hypothetical protein